MEMIVVKARFFREYKFLNMVDHPNLPKAMDCFEENQSQFMIIEYVNGQTMNSLLKSEKKLTFAEQIAVANKIAKGIEVLHVAGIVHRDIKPANIMIDSYSGAVKILDLGVAKDTQSYEQLTQKGVRVGTVAYMSPEHLHGKTNEKCDIYALGLCLYQFFLWEKYPPLMASTLTEILERIFHETPPSLYDTMLAKYDLNAKEKDACRMLSNVIDKAIKKSPKARWQNCGILAKKFAEILDVLKQKLPEQTALMELTEEMSEALRNKLYEFKSSPTAKLKKRSFRLQRYRKGNSKSPYPLIFIILIILLSILLFFL